MTIWNPCRLCGEPLWGTDHDGGCPAYPELAVGELFVAAERMLIRKLDAPCQCKNGRGTDPRCPLCQFYFEMQSHNDKFLESFNKKEKKARPHEPAAPRS